MKDITLPPELYDLVVKGKGPLWKAAKKKHIGDLSLLANESGKQLAKHGLSKQTIASILANEKYACAEKATKERGEGESNKASRFQRCYDYYAEPLYECYSPHKVFQALEDEEPPAAPEAKPLPAWLEGCLDAPDPQTGAPGPLGPLTPQMKPPPQPLPFKLVRDCYVDLTQEDLVEGLIRQRTVVVVYGPPGSGKTYLAVDASMHIAAGRQWHGRDVEQGGVVYIAAEACESVNMRVHAFKREVLGDEHADLPMIVVQTNINLLKEVDEEYDDDEIDRVLATIGAAAEQRQLGPIRLVVLDTLAACMPGANENDSAVMTRVTAAAARIVDEVGAATMILHHPVKDPAGRQRGGRGHGSLQGAITSEILVEKVDQGESGNLHTVSVTKQRDLPDTTHFGFRLKVVEMGRTVRRNKLVTTCVVEPCEYSGKATRARDLTPQQQLTLRCLVTVLETDGRAPTEEEIAANPETLVVGMKVVSKEAWKARAMAEGVSEAAPPGDDSKTKNPSRPFNRCVTALKERRLVHEWNGAVWQRTVEPYKGNGADPGGGEVFRPVQVQPPVGSPGAPKWT